MSTKSYSKSSSLHYDEMPTQNTSLMANEFCEPWQDQWTNAHLAHTSSLWHVDHDFDHRFDHGVATTAAFLDSLLETQKEQNFYRKDAKRYRAQGSWRDAVNSNLRQFSFFNNR